jgi:hypothetical protein
MSMAKGEKRRGIVRPAFNQKSAAVSTGKDVRLRTALAKLLSNDVYEPNYFVETKDDVFLPMEIPIFLL